MGGWWETRRLLCLIIKLLSTTGYRLQFGQAFTFAQGISVDGAGIFMFRLVRLSGAFAGMLVVAKSKAVIQIVAFSSAKMEGGAMSEYVKTETCFIKKHLPELVQALEGIFGKGSVEVHKEAVPLRGYKGDIRSNLAHIIVRKAFVDTVSGGASNDIGFVINGDRIDIELSAYDRRVLPTATFMTPLKKTYNKLVVQKTLRLGGFFGVKTEEKNGRIVIRASRL